MVRFSKGIPAAATAFFGLLITLTGGSEAADGPDLIREQRLVEQIEDAIIDGATLWLDAAGHRFFAIYTETDAAAPRGAVLLLHGRGFHPDWVDVVHPLRVGLTEHGWNTLSIQLPVLEKNAKYFDYLPMFPAANPRIESAIAYLRFQDNQRIVVAAHSCGFHMAQHWLHAKGESALRQFDAFIGIGMGATDYRQPMQEPFVLDQIRAPVLDIYGSDDYPAVLRTAEERLAMLQEVGNPLSAQISVMEADHYFKDTGTELTEQVAGWLKTLD
jgi:hypothetical protein